ncbi:MAG: hypothetical protein CL676_08460 [Bdellovibrionaceae bacterium]|nr:hypothetical protein [Pseudobdellovibrionaceae bacterium]|tara:strand:- start:2779 stop:3468 length:690 start_codon:yes stop_codon:yes gene_type:complete
MRCISEKEAGTFWRNSSILVDDIKELVMDKIICIGKNYLKHALELNEAAPENPVVFFKPPSCLVDASQTTEISLPWSLGEIHHELELVFQLGKDNHGKIQLKAWTLGLDLTARDLQKKLKDSGHPWERAKAFPQSAVIGPFQKLSSLEELLESQFSLTINGNVAQKTQGKEMTWSPTQLLSDLESSFTICDGDLLFTGTPEGVGPLHPGDQLNLTLGDSLNFQVTIAKN